MSACSLKQRPTSITTAIKVVEHHLIKWGLDSLTPRDQAAPDVEVLNADNVRTDKPSVVPRKYDPIPEERKHLIISSHLQRDIIFLIVKELRREPPKGSSVAELLAFLEKVSKI